MRLFVRTLLVFIVLLAILFPLAYANAAPSYFPLVPCGRAGQPDCTECDLLKLGKNITDFGALFIVPIVGTLYVLIAGFLILFGGPKPSMFAYGKKMLTNLAIGLLIIGMSWLVINFILKSLAGDSDIANEWWKITCTSTQTVVTGPRTTPTPVVSGTGTLGTCSGIACSDSSPNICGQDATASCYESQVNKWDSEINRVVAKAGQNICGNVKTESLLKAIMSQESGGVTGRVSFNGSSFGLMQIQPETGDLSQNKAGCTTANVTKEWLLDPKNSEASICIATNILKNNVGACGCDVRQLAAGYNGGGAGKGACGASTSCQSCSICGSSVTKRWECPWDGPDKEHQVCNTDRLGSDGKPDNFGETRKYVPKVMQCYENYSGR